MIEVELSGAAEVITALNVAADKILPAARAITEAAGEELRQRWVDNATDTAGVHGKRYPKAITAETVLAFGGAAVDVGPDSSKPQGGMGQGFEYGSVHQPPHMDGNRAADAVQPAFESQLELLAAGLL